jgi:hypothetical protein
MHFISPVFLMQLILQNSLPLRTLICHLLRLVKTIVSGSFSNHYFSQSIYELYLCNLILKIHAFIMSLTSTAHNMTYLNFISSNQVYARLNRPRFDRIFDFDKIYFLAFYLFFPYTLVKILYCSLSCQSYLQLTLVYEIWQDML